MITVLVTEVLKLLDAYGVQSYERERERVQVAIVTLSEGDEAKLRYLIDVAQNDYRDVLFWAATARLGKSPSCQPTSLQNTSSPTNPNSKSTGPKLRR